MGMNSLPKTVTRQCRDCDSNPGPSVPESSTLTTRLPITGEHTHGQTDQTTKWANTREVCTLKTLVPFFLSFQIIILTGSMTRALCCWPEHQYQTLISLHCLICINRQSPLIIHQLHSSTRAWQCDNSYDISLYTTLHSFNGPFSGTTQVSRYQKGKTNLDFNEARDSEWQWHQLGRMQVCTSLQSDNHASTPPLSFYRPDALPAAQPTASKHWRDSYDI